jgi:DNA polymerase-3 subunit epsilon
VGASPLLAFHAAFDQTLIGAPSQADLGPAPRWRTPGWTSSTLCAVTAPEVRARPLAGRMDGAFRHPCAVRHQAAADTLADCELLQRVWPRVAAQCRDWRSVQKLAAQQRWVTG